MMEDRILLWKFKRGSRDALRRIYEKYRNDLLKLAIPLVTDVNTAEDVVQDVFVAFERCVLGAMGEFSDSGTPPADATWQKVVDLTRQIRNH
jgi:DNA-directed RNA polymerase specialized sigma24 family protein